MQAQSADHADFPGLYAYGLLVGDDRMMFPEIDKRQAVVDVQNFFDHTLPRLLNFAGRSINELTKPEEWQRHYKEEPAGNEFNQMVDGVLEAIGIMRDGDAFHYHRTLLVDFYVKRQTNLDEEIKLGLSRQSAIRYRHEACVEFVECYCGVMYRRGLDTSLVLSRDC